ncbi:MAG: type II toxin-antitoxin system VapC family toxin [Richelia sp. RM2_1_2]|nr:type II toxin-antitoxin system VapC family toxin [Richelia sp. RM1_1_1]NJO62186.1 type II toxin-antitoxin system VapC family toxin [Richelia sp. RM2_1_2]
MNVLLDTHVLIWWSISPSNLSENVYKLLDNQVNNLFFSLASIWEMQIKLQIGKLSLNLPLPELIEDQRQTNGLQLLSIETSHIYALNNLPSHHKDPFDRILIAQAMVEQMPVVSIDEVFDNYPIKRLW